jgi:hypothetical protein
MAAVLAVVSIAAMPSTACKKNEPAVVAQRPAVASVGANGTVEVVVDGSGYHPATINAPAGRAVTLGFTRTSDEGNGGICVSTAVTRAR